MSIRRVVWRYLPAPALFADTRVASSCICCSFCEVRSQTRSGEWPSFWETVGDVIHFHREDGLYNWRRDDPKVFIADFYYTIHDNLFKSRN